MTNKEIKQYVKAWMNSHQPNTFVKNENGVVMYSAGHSSINLTLFFEDLLEDFAQSSLFSKKDREIEELKKEIKEMQIVEKDICDLTWKQNKIIQSLKSQPDSKGGRDLSDEEINSLSYQYASKEYVGENNTFQVYACQDGYKKGYYDALKLSSKEESKAGFSEEWKNIALMLYGLCRATYGKEFDEWPESKEFKRIQSLTPPTSKVEAKPSLQEGEKKTALDFLKEEFPNIYHSNRIELSDARQVMEEYVNQFRFTHSKEAVEAKPEAKFNEVQIKTAIQQAFLLGEDQKKDVEKIKDMIICNIKSIAHAEK